MDDEAAIVERLRAQINQAREAAQHSRLRLAASVREWIIEARAEQPQLLIVDDDREFCEVLAELASSWGYSVTQAHTGQQALTLARAVPFDAVITDALMPDITGMELCARLRRRSQRPLVPVVLVSGSGVQATLDAVARKCGANYAMIKPLDGDVLRTTLARLNRIPTETPTPEDPLETPCPTKPTSSPGSKP